MWKLTIRFNKRKKVKEFKLEPTDTITPPLEIKQVGFTELFRDPKLKELFYSFLKEKGITTRKQYMDLMTSNPVITLDDVIVRLGTPRNVQELQKYLTPRQGENFSNIFKDQQLTTKFFQYLKENKINSREDYLNHVQTHPTVEIDGRIFVLERSAANQKLREFLTPQATGILTKEILEEIFTKEFPKDIPITVDLYREFIEHKTRKVTVPKSDGTLKNASAYEYNGNLYPIPAEFRLPRGHGKYDAEVIGWIRELINKHNKITTDEKITKYLYEADEETIKQILSEVIKQMVSLEIYPLIGHLDYFIKNYLYKTKVKTNHYLPYIEFNNIRYLFTNSKLLIQSYPKIKEIWNNLSEVYKLQGIGAKKYLIEKKSLLEEQFPNLKFKLEVNLNRLSNNDFINWMRNNFSDDTEINKPKLLKTNTEKIFTFLQTIYKNNFSLSTIKDKNDKFSFEQQNDGTWNILVENKTRRLNRPTTRIVENQIFAQVIPSRYALDLVVFQNDKPIAIYEYDGEYHYAIGSHSKINFMTDVLNDQIQKYYIQNILKIPYFRIPYFAVNHTSDVPDYIIEHLKTLIQS